MIKSKQLMYYNSKDSHEFEIEKYNQDFEYNNNNNLSDFYLDRKNHKDVSNFPNLDSVLLQITCKEKHVLKKINYAPKLTTTNNRKNISNNEI